jgi:hypothetical protein
MSSSRETPCILGGMLFTIRKALHVSALNDGLSLIYSKHNGDDAPQICKSHSSVLAYTFTIPSILFGKTTFGV